MKVLHKLDAKQRTFASISYQLAHNYITLSKTKGLIPAEGKRIVMKKKFVENFYRVLYRASMRTRCNSKRYPHFANESDAM